MDDYMFREYVKNSRTVAEDTSYLEIFSYSVSPTISQPLSATETNVQPSRTRPLTPLKKNLSPPTNLKTSSTSKVPSSLQSCQQVSLELPACA